jgi:hypothetical protein
MIAKDAKDLFDARVSFTSNKRRNHSFTDRDFTLMVGHTETMNHYRGLIRGIPFKKPARAIPLIPSESSDDEEKSELP